MKVVDRVGILVVGFGCGVMVSIALSMLTMWEEKVAIGYPVSIFVMSALALYVGLKLCLNKNKKPDTEEYDTANGEG